MISIGRWKEGLASAISCQKLADQYVTMPLLEVSKLKHLEGKYLCDLSFLYFLDFRGSDRHLEMHVAE